MLCQLHQRLLQHSIKLNISSFVPKEPDILTRIALLGFQKFIDDFDKFVVITGAGVSTESGIPDYRSEKVGRFSRTNHKPITIQQFLSDPKLRKRFWARNYVGWPVFSAHEPNFTHYALSEAEKVNRIEWLITQNVDNLHQKAGSKNVSELHGSGFRVNCLNCGEMQHRNELQNKIKLLNPNWDVEAVEVAPDGDVDISFKHIKSFKTPFCQQCGPEVGILKPDVVFFGDSVSKDKVNFLINKVEQCDALLIFGTSLSTMSAFRFIIRAVEAGKPIAMVNIGSTRADMQVDLKLENKCSHVLSQIKFSAFPSSELIESSDVKK